MPSKKKSETGQGQLALDTSLTEKPKRERKPSKPYLVASLFVELFRPGTSIQRHTRSAKYLLEQIGKLDIEVVLERMRWVASGWYGDTDGICIPTDLLDLEQDWWSEAPEPPPVYSAWYTVYQELFGEPNHDGHPTSNSGNHERVDDHPDPQPVPVSDPGTNHQERAGEHHQRVPPLEHLDVFSRLGIDWSTEPDDPDD